MATLCRRGLHSLDDPRNVLIERSTGKRRCRACRGRSGHQASLVEIQADQRLVRMLPTAQQIVGATRERDRDRITELVADADWPALLICLAAMVDADQEPMELLAWTRADEQDGGRADGAHRRAA